MSLLFLLFFLIHQLNANRAVYFTIEFSRNWSGIAAPDGFKGLQGEPFKQSVNVRRTRVRKDVRGLDSFFAIAGHVTRLVTRMSLISLSSLSFNLSVSSVGFVPFEFVTRISEVEI